MVDRLELVDEGECLELLARRPRDRATARPRERVGWVALAVGALPVVFFG